MSQFSVVYTVFNRLLNGDVCSGCRRFSKPFWACLRKWHSHIKKEFTSNAGKLLKIKSNPLKSPPILTPDIVLRSNTIISGEAIIFNWVGYLAKTKGLCRRSQVWGYK